MKLDKKWIKEFKPCSEGVEWLEAQEERNGIKVIKKLIKENQLEWASWTIVTIMTRKQHLAYAIYSVEQVIDIYEKKYPDEKQPRQAIEAARVVLKRDTKKNRELALAASDAAWSAAWSAAGSAASAVARSAASAVAWSAVWSAAWYTARSAAWSAAWAVADAARSAAKSATWSAADEAGSAAMQKKILNYGLKLLRKKKQ